MYYEAHEIELKNGAKALFRSPCVDDAQELLDYLRKTSGETPYLLRTPQECTLTLEEEKAIIEGWLSAPGECHIVCEIGGRLAGACMFSRKTKNKNSHRALLGIALLKAFWGLGIGTAMMNELCRIARETGVEQIELEVIEGNERAMALYRKMGFTVTGAIPDAIRLADGTRLQEIYMVKRLGD